MSSHRVIDAVGQFTALEYRSRALPGSAAARLESPAYEEARGVFILPHYLPLRAPLPRFTIDSV